MRVKCKKVRHNLYRIPIAWRSTGYGRDSVYTDEMRVLEIDNVGFFHYSPKGEPERTESFYRSILMSRQYGFIVIEAESFHEAIAHFYENWKGSNVGGGTEEQKAIWITRGLDDGYGEPIMQLPKCSMTCWETGDDWQPQRLVCGGGKCSSYCINPMPNDECQECLPSCGMHSGDFDCEGCPATQNIYLEKTYQNPNPQYPLQEIEVYNGLSFRCVVSKIVDYE
jgi:hypothetical protein